MVFFVFSYASTSMTSFTKQQGEVKANKKTLWSISNDEYHVITLMANFVDHQCNLG